MSETVPAIKPCSPSVDIQIQKPRSKRSYFVPSSSHLDSKSLSSQNTNDLPPPSSQNLSLKQTLKEQSFFYDYEYLQKLTDYLKKDSSKTVFRQLGTHDKPTEETMIYIGNHDRSNYFCKLSNFDAIEPLDIHFQEDFEMLVMGMLAADLKNIAWVITRKDQWGLLFHIDSDSTKELHLNCSWKFLMKAQFFSDQIKSMMKEKVNSLLNNKFTKNKQFAKKLTYQEILDINWIYNLERDHTYESCEKLSGTYIIKKGFKSQISIPCGILKSRNTVSIIRYIACESQDSNNSQSLIIVSEYTLIQAKEEFEKYAPELRVFVIAEFSDLEKLTFENSNQDEYDVILANRKIFEEDGSCPIELSKVHFQRIIVDDIDEILVRKSRIRKTFETMRFAQNYSLNSQENEINISYNNTQKFLQAFKSLKAKFTWGRSLSSFAPSQIFYNFQEMINLGLSTHDPQIFDQVQKNFLESHVQANTNQINGQHVIGTVIDVEHHRFSNFSVEKTDLIEFINPANEDPVTVALEIINHKQQAEINNIQSQKDQDHSERIRALKAPNNFYSQASKLLSSSQFDCPVCLAELPNTNLVVLECLHHLCEDCCKHLQLQTIKCPVCTTPVDFEEPILHPRYKLPRKNKLLAILEEIRRIPPREKIIIFAEFSNVVEKLYQSLTEFNIPTSILKGNCYEISNTLKKFRQSSDTSVLIMTVKQGTSAIDLFEANHIFFVQPLSESNATRAASLYEQCTERVLGPEQKKRIDVKLFLSIQFEDHMEDIFTEP